MTSNDILQNLENQIPSDWQDKEFLQINLSPYEIEKLIILLTNDVWGEAIQNMENN